MRQWCEGRYLSLTRFREWEDVHHQLKELVRGLGWRVDAKEAGYEAVHRAVLAAVIAGGCAAAGGACHRLDPGGFAAR